METTTNKLLVSLEDLQEITLTVRYGADGQIFTIPGSDITDWVLERFIAHKSTSVGLLE